MFMKKNQANCAAVVVTFYPDQEIKNHISRLCSLCHTVVIVDNTPTQRFVTFPSRQNLIIHRNNSNEGLAYALNKGVELAHDAGFENLFLLDQDTRVPLDYFKEMLDFKDRVEAVSDHCAFCVPNFYDRNSHSFARFPVVRPISFRHVTCGSFDYDMVKGVLIAITSGMLINYQRYLEIGPFPEDYFIDFIDNDYCLKAGTKGLSIAVNCGVLIDHAIGHRRTHNLMGLQIKPSHHSPVRRYYISRNGIKTALTFGKKHPSFAFLVGLRLIHEFISILLYEKHKKEKVAALIIGCLHSLSGRMGRIKCKQSE